MSLLLNGLSGASAARTALDVSSQNVANVMTPGYTRQGIVLAAVSPLRGGLSAGDGVSAGALVRFADGYKTQQLWRAASSQGEHRAAEPYLTQLQQVMGDADSGLNGALDGFFGALSAASVDPSSAPLRHQILDAAGALANRFNLLGGVLASQRAAVNTQRVATVEQVQVLMQDLATLNGRVAEAKANGASTSGLVDQRDLKVDALAALVGVQTMARPDGGLDITLPGGQPLVLGQQLATMEAAMLPDGSTELRLSFAAERFRVNAGALGGALGGLQAHELQVLEPMRDAVATMAGELAQRVNGLLAAGFGVDGSSGRPLFVFDPTSSNRMLSVDPSVLPESLGLSGNPMAPGDSQRLLDLIALEDQPLAVAGLGTVRFGDVYTQLVGRLGVQGQQNAAALKTAETVREHAERNSRSTSAVNGDEEAIALVQYQQMYQANMKVIAVANELFDSLLQAS